MTNEPKNNILLLAAVGFTKSYGGTLNLIRLIESISSNSVKIRVRDDLENAVVYARIGVNVSIIPFRREQNVPIRRIRELFDQFTLLVHILRCNVLIITEERYLILAYIAKLLKPGLKVICFMQELHLPSEYTYYKFKLYAKATKAFDLFIDVDEDRLSCRASEFSLPTRCAVLPNTVEKNQLLGETQSNALINYLCKYGKNIDRDRPIVIYTGGVDATKPLDRILEAISLCNKSFSFVAFCNADPKTIERLQRLAVNKSDLRRSICVLPAISKEDLMLLLPCADVGIVDYSIANSDTANQRYCAPTKFYEYLRAGLAVATSENVLFRKIIDNYGCGCYAESASVNSLANAIDICVSEDLYGKRNKALEAFDDLCLDRSISAHLIQHIKDVIA